MATTPKGAIVTRRVAGERNAAGFEDDQLREFAFDGLCRNIIADALQDFAEGDVRQPQTLVLKCHVEPVRFRIPRARDLLRLTLETRGVEIAVPRDLPSQATETALPPGLDQQAEGFLDHGSFRSGTAAAHRLAHQAIVDIDVGSHLQPMCKIHTLLCIEQDAVSAHDFGHFVEAAERGPAGTRMRSSGVNSRVRIGDDRGNDPNPVQRQNGVCI